MKKFRNKRHSCGSRNQTIIPAKAENYTQGGDSRLLSPPIDTFAPLLRVEWWIILLCMLILFCEGNVSNNKEIVIPGSDLIGSYEAVVTLSDRRVEITPAQSLNSTIVAGENLVASGFPFSIWGTLYYNAGTKDAAIDFTVTNKHPEIALQRVDLRVRAITDSGIVIVGDTPSGDVGTIVPGGFKYVGTVPCSNGTKSISSWQFQNVTGDYRFWFDVYGDRAVTIDTIAGNGTNTITGDGGLAKDAGISLASAVAIDPSGRYKYIIGASPSAFTPKRVIRGVKPDGTIETIAGIQSRIFKGDGIPASEAVICDGTYGLVVAGNGDIYFTDGCWISKIDAQTGIIKTVAGQTLSTGEDCDLSPQWSSICGFAGDGGPATSALFWGTYDVTFDNYGNMLISDGNKRIRRVDKNTGIITTIAGFSSTCTSCIETTDPLQFCMATIFLEVAPNDDIFVNGNIWCNDVRKISNGIITKVAGNGNSVCGIDLTRRKTCEDGYPATLVPIDYAWDLKVHPDGSLYISDKDCNLICRVDPAGYISSVAGKTNPMDTTGGYAGDTYPARDEAMLHEPNRIELLDPKHLIFADYGNARIRQLAFP